MRDPLLALPKGESNSKSWSRGADLNRRPADYESAALPTELPRLRDLNLALPGASVKRRADLTAC